MNNIAHVPLKDKLLIQKLTRSGKTQSIQSGQKFLALVSDSLAMVLKSDRVLVNTRQREYETAEAFLRYGRKDDL